MTGHNKVESIKVEPVKSGLIKAGTVLVSSERRSTQPVTATPVATPVEPAVDLQAQRIAELETALHDANTRLASQAKAGEAREKQALERGREAGLKAGREQAQQRYDQHLDALTNAVASARETFERALSEDARALGIALGQAALDRVLGDSSRHAELIAASVAHHLRTVSEDSVLAIEVSGEDFPDAQALHDAFAAHNTVPTQRVVAEPGRAPGSCTIRLTLGRLDLGLRSQQARLHTTFAQLPERG